MTQQQTEIRPVTSRRWAVLAVLCVVQFMLTVDDNVVNVALPSIQHDLSSTSTDLAWVVNAYVLAYGGLLILGGKFGDRYGMVRNFTIGTALFALASLACGLAQAPWQLILARFVQGCGAALVTPTVLGFIMLTFTEDRERAKALSAWGTTAIVGSLSGVIISGLITDLGSWRGVFFINLPVAVFAVIMLPYLTKGVQPAKRDVSVDPAGALLLVVGLGALVYGLLSVHGGGGGVRLAILGALAVVLLGGLTVQQRRSDSPLVPRGVFESRTRIAALVCGILIFAATFPAFFTLTLLMQNGLGYDALHGGLAYVPVCVVSIMGVRAGGWVMARVGGGPVLIVTCVGCAVGGGLLSLMGHTGTGYLGLLPGMLVFFANLGAAIPAAADVALKGVAPEASGIASAMVSTTHQLGGALGLAMSAALLGASGTAYSFALAAVGVLSLLAAMVAVVIIRNTRAERAAG